MQTLDPRTATALIRLQANPDFQLYQSWLTASLTQADESNRRLEGPALHRSQGSALALEQLLKAPQTAQQALARSQRG
ncbi:hypothetical protein D0B54_18075 [Solimonas sp. K1W22B-7]|uniref:hypothetical protein n=1 Tax=Solimonas sp. K1W22B-7 TaxID=2303331 RepID=UPI000E330AFE|nr:hypothetical protein [Solimonas sp. K1W22B-7]AXQ30467.1 hypothetical protein D0B54_18075 [Solimonas sp. K1W22B-7]